MKIIVIQQFTSPVLELCIVELKGTGDKAYYSYDGSGQRVRKVVVKSGKKTERLYLGGLERYREYSASGTVKLERWTLQVDDIAQVDTLTVNNSVTVATPIPLVRYQYRDHLGSATLETNEDGVVISYEEYHPYGTSAYRTAKSGTDLSLKRYRFTDKERDDETGLYYFGVRYYAAWLGRWTSSDPGDFLDGLNLYQYARGNPVKLVDEEGYKAELVIDDPPVKPAVEGLPTDNTYENNQNVLLVDRDLSEPWKIEIWQRFDTLDESRRTVTEEDIQEQAFSWIDYSRKHGRNITTYNMFRYLEGEGGYDIMSIHDLIEGEVWSALNNMTSGNYYMGSLRRLIDKSVERFTKFAQDEVSQGLSGQVVWLDSRTQQQAVPKVYYNDLYSAFGSHEVNIRGVLNFDEDGNATGTLYYSLNDIYRFTPGRDEAGVDHDAWIRLEELGAAVFSTVAYWKQDITIKNGKVEKGLLKDSFELDQHVLLVQPFYYGLPKNAGEPLNDYRKKY